MSEARQSRRKLVIAGLSALALAAMAGYAYLSSLPPPLPIAPLDAVPAGAAGVFRIDLQALLQSSGWDRWGRAQGLEAGFVRFEERCGVDLRNALDSALVTVDGEVPRAIDHVSIAVRGTFDWTDLRPCFENALDEDTAEFHQIEIEGVPAIAPLEGDSRLAIFRNAAVVFGREPAVRRFIEAARAELPSVASSDATGDQELRALWESVAGRDITAAALIPEAWRREAEAHPALREATETLPPLSNLRGVAFGARVRRGLSFSLRLRFESAEAALEVREWLQLQRNTALDDLLVSLSGAAPALRALAIDNRGTDVVVAVDLSEAQFVELAQTLDRLRE